MSNDSLDIQPRFGDAGVETYRNYVSALLPFKDASRKTLRCLDGQTSNYLRLTDEVTQAMFRLDSQPMQWPVTEIDEINLFPNAVDILNTRARIWSSRAEKASSTLELTTALRLARKLRGAQGPMIVWLCGVACEYRILRALKCVLSGFSPRELKSQLWTEFPNIENHRTELADVWRAEFVFIEEKARTMPLEEAVKDYVKIGPFMRTIDETKESAWPLDERIIDKSETMAMVEQICRSEINWWQGGGPVPRYNDLWKGVPVPPLPGSNHQKFRALIADIENPLGKHIARRISQVAWMGRTACAVRWRKLAVTRGLYALRSLSFRELRRK